VSNIATEPASSTLSNFGRRTARHSLFRFLVTGGLSAAIDAGLLVLLHGILHVQLSVATLLSVMVAFFANFALNKLWSFSSRGFVGSQFIRYAILAGGNWVFTVLSVLGLAATGMHYLIAKAITLAVAAGGNYVGYRLWVFRAKAPAPTV
jgi:putative flippase GtrA